ncbi:hypothetical protein [Pseudogracilibacillus sp. SO30301A]
MSWQFWKKKQGEQVPAKEEVLKEKLVGLREKIETLENQMNRMIPI